MKILVFDVKGEYAHFKKYYATTSAVSYLVPPKTTLMGLLWAIGATEDNKNKDRYLHYFQEPQCKIGISVLKPLTTTRININLRPTYGMYVDNRKPTIMEFVKNPIYRIYFAHTNTELYQSVKRNLENATTVYTPTLGIANLLATIQYKGEYDADEVQDSQIVEIQTVVPKSVFNTFDAESIIRNGNEFTEQSMCAIEMDTQRNVTKRDDILFERNGKAFNASLSIYYKTNIPGNIVLF